MRPCSIQVEHCSDAAQFNYPAPSRLCHLVCRLDTDPIKNPTQYLSNCESDNMDILGQDELYTNALLFVFIAAAYHRRRWRRRPKRFQTRPWILRREEQGHHHNLLQELRFAWWGTQDYRQFLRIGPEIYQELLEKLRPRLTRQDTRLRKALDPELKLAATVHCGWRPQHLRSHRVAI